MSNDHDGEPGAGQEPAVGAASDEAAQSSATPEPVPSGDAVDDGGKPRTAPSSGDPIGSAGDHGDIADTTDSDDAVSGSAAALSAGALSTGTGAVSAGSARAAARRSAARAGVSEAKGTATPKRAAATTVKRPNVFARFGRFLREVVAELRKVIWPTRNQMVTYTIVVIAFVAFMVALVGVLDLLFAKGVLAVFG